VSAPFALTTAYLGTDASVVTVVGELDAATAPGLSEELRRIADDGTIQVVVDLLKVPFVDSVALGILVEASKQAGARGGTLRIVCDDRRIARIIEVTGLGRILRVHATLREALEELDAQALSRVGAA
jgi:anti-sigma B factor antagonist